MSKATKEALYRLMKGTLGNCCGSRRDDTRAVVQECRRQEITIEIREKEIDNLRDQIARERKEAAAERETMQKVIDVLNRIVVAQAGKIWVIK